MDELLLRLVVLIFKGLYRLLIGVVRLIGKVLRKQAAARTRAAPQPMSPPPRLAPAPPPRLPAGVSATLEQQLRGLAARARTLDEGCAEQPLCALLTPSLKTFAPRADALVAELRRATTMAELAQVARAGQLINDLLALFGEMVEQRRNADLIELIDDADALAEACYRPIVGFCQERNLPLGSDRVAALFGDDCSPALARVGDPAGLAILQLPWSWLAEVYRWPAIGHEVGHDFYSSLDGLDDEVLARLGLAQVRDGVGLCDGRVGFTTRDLDGLIARWRHELSADAFGVMMLGPAYAVTTLTIFARPAEPDAVLVVEQDDVDKKNYEVHPPAHVRAAFVCRLLERMGYGALGEAMELKWRVQHGEPSLLYLPTTTGWLQISDEAVIARALAVGETLYQDGYRALQGTPLRSIPGFDFGPREHQTALAIRDEFLAGRRPRIRDARLLIAGAVLAWAKRPDEAVRLLAEARLAIGKLALAVPGAPAPPRDSDELTPDLIRESLLLDILLTPPRASMLRR
jgi:hypothetical protein